jgi:hypothetical protein
MTVTSVIVIESRLFIMEQKFQVFCLWGVTPFCLVNVLDLSTVFCGWMILCDFCFILSCPRSGFGSAPLKIFICSEQLLTLGIVDYLHHISFSKMGFLNWEAKCGVKSSGPGQTIRLIFFVSTSESWSLPASFRVTWFPRDNPCHNDFDFCSAVFLLA